MKTLLKCKHCKKKFEKKPGANYQKYCSVKCRNKNHYNRVGKYWARNKRDKEAASSRSSRSSSKNKIQCLICGLWYVQVGSHVYSRHGMTAREYRELHNLEVKKGIVPKWYRKLKGDIALANGTYKNLRVGKKYWVIKGDTRVGNYKRSPITIKRLRNLHKFTKRYKKYETKNIQ